MRARCESVPLSTFFTVFINVSEANVVDHSYDR